METNNTTQLTPTIEAFRQAIESVGMTCIVDGENQLSTGYDREDYAVAFCIRQMPTEPLVSVYGFYDFRLKDHLWGAKQVCKVNTRYSEAIFNLDLENGVIAYRLEMIFGEGGLSEDDCRHCLQIASGVMDAAYPDFCGETM